MNKKNYSKPETTLFELKYRTSIILTSPGNPEGDPDPDNPDVTGGADPGVWP